MRISAGTLVLLLAALPCHGQQSSQNSAPNSEQGQSSSQSQAQDQSQPQSQSTDKSQAPDGERKRLPLGKRPATADENPFPEDISKKAAAAAGNPAPDAPSAEPAAKSDKPPASSNDSQPDYSSSRTGLPDLDADSRESRISNGAGGYILNPQLAMQDVKIGGFYLNAGDYKGAYARFKEATEVNPENADAVFGLAEAARGLKLKDEAADNYRIYLDAVPDGPKSKAARKALAALGAPPKK
ncbi:MAG TPA: tetratricopeptide repeat protein [Silvibacterium sp.]|nr:tetratricopeptide repeat protein [Silvibacterium sp.]